MRVDFGVVFPRVRSGLRLGLATLLLALLAASPVKSGEAKAPPPAAPKGQRVFTCAHSFHVFVYRILGEKEFR
jgi:hypothetical protein